MINKIQIIVKGQPGLGKSTIQFEICEHLRSLGFENVSWTDIDHSDSGGWPFAAWVNKQKDRLAALLGKNKEGNLEIEVVGQQAHREWDGK